MSGYYIGHVHTWHSHDSLSPPKLVVERAKALGVTSLLVTDHETLAGSIEARRYAQAQGYKLQIPIAAEVRTDIGDVIVANVPEDFELSRDHVRLAKSCKAAGGVTIVPHPYYQHRLEDIDWSVIDAIETVNGRCSSAQNERAAALAQKLGKPEFYGADAHFLRHMESVMGTYTGEFLDLEHRLVQSGDYRLVWTRTSSLIKAMKRKNWKGGVLGVLGIARNLSSWKRRSILQSRDATAPANSSRLNERHHRVVG